MQNGNTICKVVQQLAWKMNACLIIRKEICANKLMSSKLLLNKNQYT